MSEKAESSGFMSGSWEAKESEPSQRHEIAIEQEADPDNAERAEWLAAVWDVNRQEDAEQARQMLEDWKQDLPEQAGVIENLPFSKNFSDVINDAHMWGDEDRIREMQRFCRAVLGRYGSEDGSKGWRDLPEKNKRYVRVAEMMIFMIDANRLGRNIRQGKGRTTDAMSFAKKLQRYSESTDIPKRYRESVIAPILEEFTKQFSKDKKASLDPEQKKQLKQILEAIRKHNKKNRQKPGDFRPNSGDTPDEPQGEVIDMEFNPVTGNYEEFGTEDESSAEEVDAPKRLTHDPGPSSSEGEGTAGGE